MAEEFHGGVCSGTWWNPPRNLFSGGGLSSPCSVAQLGGGGCYDNMNNFGIWPSHEVTKCTKPNVHHNNFERNNSFCDENSLVFPADNMDSTLDIFGFGLSPTTSTTDWSQPNLICDNRVNNVEGNFESLLQEDVNSGLSYGGITANSPPSIMNSTNNFPNNNSNSTCMPQDGSPPMALTSSSNSSGDSSTITMASPSASFLIQTLFDDNDDHHHQSEAHPLISQLLIDVNFGAMISPPTPLQAAQNNSIRAGLLNSLQSRSQAPTFNQKSHSCADNNTPIKMNNEEVQDSNKNNVNQQPPAKRARIETPSSLPTFKVRKEKLGDRITALQQLVSPFGKTDTASVLHEAIEYIKFLHDQVNVLCNPYLKNGATVQHQQGSDTEEPKQDMRSRGLCLVPISSTYPVAQETPVDFWTPTFGGTTFR